MSDADLSLDGTSEITDASLDAAAAKIMARGREAMGDRPEQEDKRQNRNDRDTIEQDETGELDEVDAAERVEGEEEEGAGEGAEDEGVQYFEFPGAEGEEPERIPATEVAEGFKQWRQMQGDMATAVIKVETEAQAKQDDITNRLITTYQAVEADARKALQLMQMYLPQAPDPIMLDRNSGYYDPEGYHNAKLYHDEFMAHARNVEATIRQAQDGQRSIGAQASDAMTARENERLARYIPEWKDEGTREAKRTEIISALEAKYGVTKDELGDVVSHKAWRMLSDLANLSKAAAKAPEVRNAVKEKAAKIVNGRVSQARAPDGRFARESRETLRRDGTEAAFANHLLRSGALRGL